MIKLKSNKQKILIQWVCCCVVLASISGCTSFRKKFVRQKKKDAQKKEFIPVLDPIDYEEKKYSAEDEYRLFYSRWQIFARDIIEGLQKRVRNEKNEKYLLGQVIVQLKGMKEILSDADRQEIQKLINMVQNVLDEYKKPKSMRRETPMLNKLKLMNKNVRNNFNPKQKFK